MSRRQALSMFIFVQKYNVNYKSICNHPLSNSKDEGSSYVMSLNLINLQLLPEESTCNFFPFISRFVHFHNLTHVSFLFSCSFYKIVVFFFKMLYELTVYAISENGAFPCIYQIHFSKMFLFKLFH